MIISLLISSFGKFLLVPSRYSPLLPISKTLSTPFLFLLLIRTIDEHVNAESYTHSGLKLYLILRTMQSQTETTGERRSANW